MTAEVTGFALDPSILLTCVAFASLFQLMKNEARAADEREKEDS